MVLAGWRIALAGLLLAGCPAPAAPDNRGGGDGPEVAIYRSGDDRVARDSIAVYRTDGNVVALPPQVVGDPLALITARREVELAAGQKTIALPEIPPSAEPGSIWLRAVSSPGRLEVAAIRRPPTFTDATSLRGRAVVAVIGDRRIEGTLVDLDERGALLDRDGTLIAVGRARLELVGGDIDPGQPFSADVVAERAGRHRLEIAYQSAALDWDLDLGLEVVAPGVPGSAQITVTPVVTVASRDLTLEGAEVTLFEGHLNAEGQRPREIWRGRLDVGPGETRRPLHAVAVEGVLEYRYRGFVGDRTSGRDHLRWGTAARELVDLVLRLPPDSLPPAPALVRVEIDTGEGARRSHRVELADVAADGEAIELVLGTARDLRGTRRQLWVKRLDGGRVVTEAYELSITNLGAEPAAVRIREPLARGDDVELIEKPEAATVDGKSLDIGLVVPANGREVVEYTARYRLRP